MITILILGPLDQVPGEPRKWLRDDMVGQERIFRELDAGPLRGVGFGVWGLGFGV